ncbi:hypothetical protein KCP78_17480 [Salmonella enterica subsp. enterica]|nr:hypothetical protein KCP78_17480 [Salmonella enterica subsp. enterica]
MDGVKSRPSALQNARRLPHAFFNMRFNLREFSAPRHVLLYGSYGMKHSSEACRDAAILGSISVTRLRSIRRNIAAGRVSRRRPQARNNVDLPQPDGPTITINSRHHRHVNVSGWLYRFCRPAFGYCL